ncbi:restriction endonuclease subunit S [Pseudomonas sp. A2]|uniref:restriction endonuclease subunit S n=1 Tax=Pseudomonas sp. A2 TaxID=107445 RepID=UPI002CF6379F|nr:restriction endonuclease subunit S [Pseudomonas sp. A2]MEB3440183.1 restriction endonuclease subunit S [Pseudomonas sp. A2]
MKALLTDNLPLLASAPNAIKKLRELILELAVRGKLVPQNPNDEPASELLKRVAEEKARLVAERNLRKQKPLEEIAEAKIPFELPPGWEWSQLGHISSDVQYGFTASANHQNEEPLLLRITDIQNDGVNWDTVPGCNIAPAEISDYELKDGDIVIARTGGTIGKSYLVSGLTRSAVFASYLIRIGRLDSIYSGFTKIFLGSTFYWKQLYANSTGTGQPNVNGTALKGLLIPLAPMAEQYRIVAKVDELMALCDRLEAQQADAESAHVQLVQTMLDSLSQAIDAADFAASWQRLAEHFQTLFTNEFAIDALKKTLLQLAVMGKLVPQDLTDESASELLKRIEREKQRLVNEGLIKKQKPLVESTNSQIKPALPSSWKWVPLLDITTGMDSGWSPACLGNSSPSDDVWGVLKTTAVQVMSYLQHENKELPSHLEPRPEAETKVGDILFTRAGPMNRVGISCLVESTRPKLMISDKIIRFHPVELGVYGRFVALCLNAGETAKYLEQAKSGMAASQVNISQEKLRLAPIPLAPLREQHRIVKKVDQLMKLCDTLTQQINIARSKQTELLDTLMAQV